MIVCHCKAICDRTIREAVRGGATSPRKVAMACQAGRECGGCVPVVRELIEHEGTRRAGSADLAAAS
ncbi:MAG: (2Fe-2S)-binding protein [Myxococcota bacterium]